MGTRFDFQTISQGRLLDRVNFFFGQLSVVLKSFTRGTNGEFVFSKPLRIGSETAAQVSSVLVGSGTWDPPNLAAGAQQTTTVTVTGAALGDLANASFSLDLAGTTLDAYVSGTDTVTVVHKNGTGGAVNLASGTLKAVVEQIGA